MNRITQRQNSRLYSDLAWTFPIISPPEDYVEETEFFSKAIKKRARIDVKTLLHLGCGGGHNDSTFKKYFKVTGVDISGDMLRLAENLNPEVIYHPGDMRAIRLRECFDAVTILDSINYMSTRKDLRSAFVTAYEHLKPGGVFLTLVEQIAGEFKQNNTECSTYAQGDIEITFVENYYDPDPLDTRYEATFVYLIRHSGELEMHTEQHVCGIFKLETWRDLLRRVGFEVKQMKFEHSTFAEGEYYQMFVCVKPL